MNIYKYYMDVVALQTKLANAYWDAFYKGMEKMNKEYNQRT